MKKSNLYYKIEIEIHEIGVIKMTDRELKKNLKKLGIMLCVLLVLVGGLAIFTLKNEKAELSIYTNAEYTNHLQALGIEEKEFREYLSVFGNLVAENYGEKERTMNMAVHFLENMSSYEVQTDENGWKTYEAEVIDKIAQEVVGDFIKEEVNASEIYEFRKAENEYVQKQDLEKIPYCVEMKEVSKKEDKIEVVYELVMMTKEQMAEYLTGQKKDLQTQTVKLELMNHKEYEYSKYFVSHMEIL